MECKFCQGQMPDDGRFCPYCGKDNNEEPQELAEAVEVQLEQDGEAIVVLEQEQQEEAQQEESAEEEAMASPQVRKLKRVAMISGCVAVLAVLATVLFFGIWGGKINLKEIFWIRENSLTGNETYSVSDSKAYKDRDKVVATMGDKQLTNGQLQAYYWLQVMEYVDQYGYYLSYIGLDYTKPLDEQVSMDKDKTWQQYFLESALNMWHSNQALAMLAEENGFKLDEVYQDYLDGLGASMEEMAKQEKLENADALIQREMGAGCTLEDYIAYTTTYYTGYMYFMELYSKMDPAASEIEAYFAENEQTFQQDGITKDSGKYYDIRHILIKVESDTTGEDGEKVSTDAQWEACREKAQELLDQYLAGELTEEAFAEIAKKNSEDANSKNNGGLYSDMTEAKVKALYSDSFADWCLAAERQSGDYGLVQSEQGYHIVYFADSQDIWYAHAREALLSEMSNQILEDALEKYPVQIDYKKIVLGVVDLNQ